MPAMIAGIFSAGSAVATPASDWTKLFPHAAQIPSVTLQADYWDEAGNKHELHLERHGSHWLHRVTDQQLELFAQREKDGQVQIRLLDRQHKKVLDAKRSGLYQVGIFEDWDQLATHLSQPKSPFLREKVAHPQQTAVACHWSQVRLQTPDSPRYQICWSPMLNSVIRLRKQQPSGTWTDLFNVTALSAVTTTEAKDRWPDVPKNYQYSNIDDDLQAD
jgi:hypothetical protein